MPEKWFSIHFDSIQFHSIQFNPKFLNFVHMLIFLYRNFQHKPPFCNMDLPELDYLSMLFILEYIQCSNKPTSVMITIESDITYVGILSSREMCILHHKYSRCPNKSNTIVFAIISGIRWAKFHLSGAIFGRISLFGFVVYLVHFMAERMVSIIALVFWGYQKYFGNKMHFSLKMNDLPGFISVYILSMWGRKFVLHPHFKTPGWHARWPAKIFFDGGDVGECLIYIPIWWWIDA